MIIVLVSLLLRSEMAVCAEKKRLIEFGWDEPDAAFLHNHCQQMQKTPFDGCVFHINYGGGPGMVRNFLSECWGKRMFRKSEFTQALLDLKSTSFGHFRHNFLRFNVTPGDIDWFDDFSPVLANARLAAVIARESHSEGILFDVEQYVQHIFDYRVQRDYRQRTWEEYAAQVRMRGEQLMQAFQQGFPAVRVFLTFGYELPWRESKNGAIPLAECSYGLLAPFLNGMLDAASSQAKLIDGYEFAYAFRQASDFLAAKRQMTTEVLPIVSNIRRYHRVWSFSFGIWLEGDWRSQSWNTTDTSHNFHTPAEFEHLTRTALQEADKYVWIYSEKPRWWTEPDGTPVDLPESYQQALFAAAKQATRPRSVFRLKERQ